MLGFHMERMECVYFQDNDPGKEGRVYFQDNDPGKEGRVYFQDNDLKREGIYLGNVKRGHVPSKVSKTTRYTMTIKRVLQ